jgi:hypothetical protein
MRATGRAVHYLVANLAVIPAKAGIHCAVG